MANKSKVKVNIKTNKTASTNKSGAVNGKVEVKPTKGKSQPLRVPKVRVSIRPSWQPD